jgi:hypothetical protein
MPLGGDVEKFPRSRLFSSLLHPLSFHLIYPTLARLERDDLVIGIESRLFLSRSKGSTGKTVHTCINWTQTSPMQVFYRRSRTQSANPFLKGGVEAGQKINMMDSF